MDNIAAIINKYGKLIDYCDSFFNAIQKLYGSHMMCKQGCSSCCKLPSVCALEAFILWKHFPEQPLPKTNQIVPNNFCDLLIHQECCLYNYRPLICRTHGIIIQQENSNAPIQSCELNFLSTTLETIPAAHLFPTHKITENLMRLNMAFCLEIEDQDLASHRFTMNQIVCKAIPKSILCKLAI